MNCVSAAQRLKVKGPNIYIPPLAKYLQNFFDLFSIVHYIYTIVTAVFLLAGQILLSSLETTVFHGMCDFELSHKICPLPRNFYVFHGILLNLLLADDEETNTAYFGHVQTVVLYVYMISP